MAPDPFAHPVTVTPEQLRIERFLETRKVQSFDSGNKDLDDFLNTEEVTRYEEEGFGRLAVDKRFQNMGIGRMLLRYIAGMAIEMGGRMGVRLLVLQAKPESIPFYEKCGFRLTYETKRERGRRNRTMFLDLFEIQAIA